MLKSHFDVVEKSLLASSQIVANAGHALHKGMPREAFIRDFLELHLPETLGIGTGEVFDASSKPNEPRNQLDILLYKRNYPKLHFGGDISAYMAESIVATIEIKSQLDKDALKQAIGAAKKIKSLQRHTVGGGMQIGYHPPSIMTYLVAYKGPANMETIHGWIPEIHAEEQIVMPDLPVDHEQRPKVINPSIDLIVVLGKGVLYCDNSPVGALPDDIRQKYNPRWVWFTQEDGNLLFLFLHLVAITSGAAIAPINPTPYLANLVINQIKCA